MTRSGISPRTIRTVGVLSAVSWTVLATILGAWLTGGLAPLGVPGLPDPGASTRVGLPVVQALRDLSAVVTVGALVVATTCVPPEPGEDETLIAGVRARLVAVAQLSATAWTAMSGLLIALVFSDASGSSIGAEGFWQQAAFFARSYELGQYLLWGAGLAALVAAGCATASRIAPVGALAALAIVALWPVALTGHATGALNHDEVVNLQMFHLVGIAVWAGGLVSLTLVGHRLGPSLGTVARRYSTLAGWCAALVTASGLAGAWLRVPDVGSLVSTYGTLLALKLTAVILLLLAGWWHRRTLLAQLTGGRTRAFWRLVVLEVLVLLGAAALGVVLGRTDPPSAGGNSTSLTMAESLLGSSMPPALDAAGWLTRWSPDTLFLPLGLAALAWYVVAIQQLRKRGVPWPWLRTACWVVGCLLFLWATNGAPATYGRVLFSMHMVQHMTIATAVPTFLVLGTPITLALRTLRRRTDGSYGPREWLLKAVHSLPAQLLGHPIVAAALFVVSMVAFYYSSLFSLSLEAHTAHVLMTLHFLLTGYLFAECIVGADPGLERPAYPLRALLVMVTFGFHALFSVSLMASTTVMAKGWFESLGRAWGASLSEDQYLGASLGWALGEYPLAVMAVALLVSWVQADRRERRRFDRSERREGDRQLRAYNDYLHRLSQDQRRSGQSTMAGASATEEDRSIE